MYCGAGDIPESAVLDGEQSFSFWKSVRVEVLRIPLELFSILFKTSLVSLTRRNLIEFFFLGKRSRSNVSKDLKLYKSIPSR